MMSQDNYRQKHIATAGDDKYLQDKSVPMTSGDNTIYNVPNGPVSKN